MHFLLLSAILIPFTQQMQNSTFKTSKAQLYIEGTGMFSISIENIQAHFSFFSKV